MTNAQPDLNSHTCRVVLVVEDEWLVRMAIVDSLRNIGLSVIEAATGAEAVEYIQSAAPIDLIFTDVQMPGHIDGLALLAFAQAAVPDVPVIVTSGHLEKAEVLSAGAIAFLAKPYTFVDVMALIVTNLGNPGE